MSTYFRSLVLVRTDTCWK